MKTPKTTSPPLLKKNERSLIQFLSRKYKMYKIITFHYRGHLSQLAHMVIPGGLHFQLIIIRITFCIFFMSENKLFVVVI
jgi:hypothetical protein